jgi:hypothetical protein
MSPSAFQEALMKLFPFTLLLGHANSAINPLLYCFMTRNFRRTLRSLFCQSGIARPRPRHRVKVSCVHTSALSGPQGRAIQKYIA